MEMPDHAWITSLPAGAQLAINAAIGIATFAGGLWAYMTQMRKAKAPPPRTDDVVVPMLQIADMSPFRDLAKQVGRMADANERVADAHDKILALADEWIEDDRNRYIRGLERMASAARRDAT